MILQLCRSFLSNLTLPQSNQGSRWANPYGKGFSINDFKSDHYPDFIVYTQSGKIILVETKGDDRDNSDSNAKNKLGRIWAKEAGPQCRYYMVFERNQHLDHTCTIREVMDLLKAL